MRHFMPPKFSLLSEPYKTIAEEIHTLKDIYPYSNNNETHNLAIEMCIKCIIAIEKQHKTKQDGSKIEY